MENKKHNIEFIQKKRNNLPSKPEQEDIDIEQTNSFNVLNESKSRTIDEEKNDLEKNADYWKRIQSEDLRSILTKSKNFAYGNYNCFYYNRYGDALKQREERCSIFYEEWFKNKKCLDIGCNIGTGTLLIAQTYSPKSIEGIDIDYRLIKSAIKTLKQGQRNEACSAIINSGDNNSNTFDKEKNMKLLQKINTLPKSFYRYSSTVNNSFNNSNSIIQANEPGINSVKNLEICNGNNIRFTQENYVSSLKTKVNASEGYDTIICLNITKYIHLHYNDTGIKVLFYNIYMQLKKGGILIFQPQMLDSYKKDFSKSQLKEIKLPPNNFLRFIEEVYKMKLLKTILCPSNSKKMYHRAIYILEK